VNGDDKHTSKSSSSEESDEDESDDSSSSGEDSDVVVSNNRSRTIVDELPVKEKSLASLDAARVSLRNKSSDSISRLRSLAFNRISYDESEVEDDSGVTDVSKHLSEIETDSENFPEMRKLTRYQRAATHSRLFKLLQDEGATCDSDDDEQSINNPRDIKADNNSTKVAHHTRPRPETMQERRERLTLPIQQSSSGVESLSSASSSSPVSGLPNEKLAEELVQSLLLRKKGRLFRNLPIERLHAAAIKILQEDVESNGTMSSSEDLIPTVDSTPAITPQEFKAGYQNSYSDYYDSWSNSGSNLTNGNHDEQVPSKLKSLQDNKKYNWSFRCPRVLSNSKNISRLADVSETETSELPRSRPLSRASNKSAELYTMSGLIDDLPPSPRTPYKQFRFNN
jgi:hypothetical protein